MLHGCPPSPDAWGRLNVVTPFHHLSGDSHINSSLREGPLRHLEPISKSPEEDNEASELYEAEEVLGVVFPHGRGCGAAIESKQRSAPQASVAYSGLAVADLAWAACFCCCDAARSSRCRPYATPHRVDRCRRRDRRLNSPAWPRSCRSRSIAVPAGLRGGWRHAY